MNVFEIGALILGLLVGSFLNVCIYRLPRDLSIVSPGSACPSCGAPIRPWDNVPLLSYAVLRGRCRSCGGQGAGANTCPAYPGYQSGQGNWGNNPQANTGRRGPRGGGRFNKPNTQPTTRPTQ